MDPTGSPQNSPSDYVELVLYGGPLDGLAHSIPRGYMPDLGAIKVIKPCNQLELEKLSERMGILIPPGTLCQYMYTLRVLDNRYVFQASALS